MKMLYTWQSVYVSHGVSGWGGIRLVRKAPTPTTPTVPVHPVSPVGSLSPEVTLERGGDR